MKPFTLLSNVLIATAFFFTASCGSDDPASDTDMNDSQSSFYYTIGDQTYTASKYWSKYWQSSIGPASLDLIHDGQKVYWELELCGTIDDAVDGNWLDFEIFAQNVGKGFELTKDNFCLPYMPFGEIGSKLYHFKKKSGSAKISDFGARSAKMVFKNFILEAEGASYSIKINGTVDLEVD